MEVLLAYFPHCGSFLSKLSAMWKFLRSSTNPSAICQNCSISVSGGGEQTILHRGGGQTVYVGGSGGHDDDEEMDVSEANFLVSEANILVSEASKLSAGARIFRGP